MKRGFCSFSLGEDMPEDSQPAEEKSDAQGNTVLPGEHDIKPNPATDAGNEDSPSGKQPPETPKEDLGEKFDNLIDKGKAEVVDALRGTAKKVIGHSRETIATLLASSELHDDDKKLCASVYHSAEKHALAGREVQAQQMVRRAVNFVRSDALVKKANKIEAVENYLSTLLTLLTSAGKAFLTTAGKSLADEALDLADHAVSDIMGAQ